MDYADMLARAKKDLPEVASSGERFSIPKAKGHVQGNATIISNFHQIADALDRPMTHISKYLSKNLAAKGVIKKDQYLVFNTKLSATKVNEKVADYADKYVICPSCGKPETEIMRKGQTLALKCNACGAQNAIKRT